MEKTDTSKDTVYIKCKGIRANAIMQYSPVLDEAITNWNGINTVRRIGDKVFVMQCSLHYFVEIVKRKSNVCVSTELSDIKSK